MREGLIGYAEISRLAGWSSPAVARTYRYKGYLPPPDLEILGRSFWEKATIEKWLRDRPRPAMSAAGAAARRAVQR